MKDADNRISLRAVIKNAFDKVFKNRITTSGIPVHTVDLAIEDARLAFKSSKALHKGQKSFRIRYKKENANQILGLEKTTILLCSKKYNSITRQLINLNLTKPNNSHRFIGPVKPLVRPDHDYRLSMRNGEFILHIPIDKVVKQCEREFTCCSIDPGLRTFQTVYCQNGMIHEFGTNVIEKLNPLLYKLNKPKTENNPQKAKYKKRIRAKIKHLVDDLHWKTAKTLCGLSDKIIIGNMSTVSILKDKTMHCTVKRLLQSISQYTFRQRLQDKCEEYGVEFIVADESYTSKTCGGCAKLNDELGSSKVFNCDCGFTADRDVNGARNIMIKYLQ